MSYGSNTKDEEQKVDTPDSQSLKHGVSVMRDFLESGIEFKWPEQLGECTENHCDISRDEQIPLKWKRLISDNGNASIDLYEARPDFKFPKTFVVKTIRDRDNQKAREQTANEVKNMKDLRHPHVTALLATFTYQARLSILIFPAACCDLQHFMERMSICLDKDQLASHSDDTSTTDGDTTVSRHQWDANVGFASKFEKKDSPGSKSEPWPLTTSTDKKVEMLRGYFVCLSEALNYLHDSDVRHKDIKPGNILIDESGSVILTDFGISRRFPKHTPHATNDERKFTRKYASPEIMEYNDTPRDDYSDVFSLGCVFLEMATLLLGKNLCNLCDHYATIVNDSSREEAYHCNLGNVHSWIDNLRASRGFKPVHEHWQPGKTEQLQNFEPSPDSHMTAALVHIRQMLDVTPANRPVSQGLWKRFQHISTIRCRDCDPRRPNDIWEPSARQQRDARTGLNNRRSLHPKEEIDLLGRGLSISSDTSSTMLSTQFIPNQSLRRSSPPIIDQNNYNRRGHIRTRSEPGSPNLQVNGEIQEGTARAIRSPSPGLHVVPSPETVPEGTKSEIAHTSAILPSANAIHKDSVDLGNKNSDNVGVTASLRPARLPTEKLDLSHRRATQRDQHSRAANQRRATGEDSSASNHNKYTLPPHTRILVYDVSQTKAFEADFAFLTGAFISCS